MHGLIFFVSCKVFVDRLTIILHTNACDVEVYCTVSCKVAAESICLYNNNLLTAENWSGICLTCRTGCYAYEVFSSTVLYILDFGDI